MAKEQDSGQQLLALSDVIFIAGRVDALNDFTGEGRWCVCVLFALDFVQRAIFFVDFSLCHFTGKLLVTYQGLEAEGLMEWRLKRNNFYA